MKKILLATILLTLSLTPTHARQDLSNFARGLFGGETHAERDAKRQIIILQQQAAQHTNHGIVIGELEKQKADLKRQIKELEKAPKKHIRAIEDLVAAHTRLEQQVKDNKDSMAMLKSFGNPFIQ